MMCSMCNHMHGEDGKCMTCGCTMMDKKEDMMCSDCHHMHKEDGMCSEGCGCGS